MSEILSVTGRDVPATPKDDHEWIRWAVFLYPAIDGLKALSGRDWPRLALWSMLIVVCGLRLWLGPLGRGSRSWPQPVKVVLIILAAVPAVLVQIGSTPWMRWAGVALGAVMIAGLLQPWRRTR